MPILTGAMEPDVRFFGFDIAAAEIGDWSIVIAEQPTAPRFGIEVDEVPAGASHLPLTAGDGDAARLATRLRQQPVRMTIPATVLLTATDEADDADRSARPRPGDRRCRSTPGPSCSPSWPRRPTRWRCCRSASRPGSSAATTAPASCGCGCSPTRSTSTATTRASAPRRSQLGRATGSCAGGPPTDDARLRERVADAGRPLRARAGGLDRPPPRTDQPRRRGRPPHSTTAHALTDAAAVPRRRRAGDRGAHTARRRTARPAGSSRPTAAARCSPSSRAATSSPISPSGPIPTTRSPPPTTTPPTLGIDEGMRWMVDFDRAEEVGMAVRLPLTGAARVGGRRRARRRRVSSDGDPEPRPSGSPPCSTPTTTPTGWRSSPRARRPTTPPSSAPASPAVTSAASRASPSSGPTRPPSSARPPTPADSAPPSASTAGPRRVDARTHRRRGGRRRAARRRRCRRRCGRRPGATTSRSSPRVDDAGRDWARDHARRHVRPAGRAADAALRPPALRRAAGDVARRLDRRPATTPTRHERLRQLLVALRDQVWRPATIGAVARSAAPTTPTPTSSTCCAATRPATATPCAGRSVRTTCATCACSSARTSTPSGSSPACGSSRRTCSTASGCPARRCRSTCSSTKAPATPLGVPLVRQPAPTARCGVHRRAARPATPTPSPRRCPDAAVPLLHALLRHALLREQAEAAARLLAGPDRTVGQLLADAELVDLVPAPDPTPTWNWQRSQPVPGPRPVAVTVREHLGALTDFAAPAVRRARRAPRGAGAARHRRSAVVERLLPAGARRRRVPARRVGHLAGHAAPGRGARPRSPTESCSAATAGWRTSAPSRAATVAELPADEPGPLIAAPDDPGFILAPSLNQASTAALLREAHLAHGGGDDSPYAIKLTSDRVRLAERLFDGVRQGIPLGVLLGYDVERRLHDAAPRRVHRRPAPHRPTRPARTASEAVDEPHAARRARAAAASGATSADAVLAQVEGLAAGDPRRDRLVRVLAWLDAAVDAAADAVTAEGVYQLARGNLVRATTLDDVAGGLARRRSSSSCARRAPARRSPTASAIVLDAAERVAAGERLGRPDHVAAGAGRATPRCLGCDAARPGQRQSTSSSPSSTPAAASSAEHRVPLPDLGLSALDLVWISGDAGAATELAAAGVRRRRAGRLRRRAGAAPRPRARRRPITARDLGDLLELAGGAAPPDRRRPPARRRRPPAGPRRPDRRVDLDELETQRRRRARRRSPTGAMRSARCSTTPPPTVGAVRERARRRSPASASRPGSRRSPAPTPIRRHRARPRSSRRAPCSPTSPAASPTPSASAAPAGRAGAGPPRAAAAPAAGRVRPRLRRRAGVQRRPPPPTSTPPAARRRCSADDPLAAYTWVTRMERVRPGLARMTMPLPPRRGARHRADASTSRSPTCRTPASGRGSG